MEKTATLSGLFEIVASNLVIVSMIAFTLFTTFTRSF